MGEGGIMLAENAPFCDFEDKCDSFFSRVWPKYTNTFTKICRKRDFGENSHPFLSSLISTFPVHGDFIAHYKPASLLLLANTAPRRYN